MHMHKQSTTIKRWKLDNNEGWKQYNNNLQEKMTKMENPTYQTLQEKMIESMKETVGEVTIRKYTGKKTERKRINKENKGWEKEIKKGTRTSNKKKHNKENRSKETEELLENYKKCQRKLREKIEENNGNQTRLRIEKLIQKGGTKSQNFWTMKKQLESQQEPDPYNTITEEGTKLTNPEEAKEYIAQYYEQLYQAREGTIEYQEWTEEIKNKVKEIETQMQHKPEIKQIDTKELNISMKGQSEIAYLPKFANMMLIVMVIVITEILYIILIFDCFENQ